MLIKNADDKTSQIAILQNLLSHESIPVEKKILIDRELRNTSIGIETERQAAFEIDFYASRSKNVFVLHDLRLDIGGRVAQIDHLLINRLLEVFVLETKTFSTGLTVNERGECSTFIDEKEVGIASPIEQNARHISVLKDAFREIELPKRMGMKLQPTFHSVVLVSPKAIINRPKATRLDASILKLDQFFSWYNKKMDGVTLKDIAGIFKLCASETVKTLSEQLLSLHQPGRIDYVKKFGIGATLINRETHRSVSPEKNLSPDATVATSKEAKQYFCANCKNPIAPVVAKFCWNNKSRFGGKAYCRVCQGKMSG